MGTFSEHPNAPRRVPKSNRRKVIVAALLLVLVDLAMAILAGLVVQAAGGPGWASAGFGIVVFMLNDTGRRR